MSPILTSILLGLTAAAANVFGGAVIVQKSSANITPVRAETTRCDSYSMPAPKPRPAPAARCDWRAKSTL